jgi:hypothetical protein
MTNFVVCDTQADAAAAMAIVDREKGFDYPRTKTRTWAIPRQRATDGKWVFVAPEPDVVAKITPAPVIEAETPDWFPPPPELMPA